MLYGLFFTFLTLFFLMYLLMAIFYKKNTKKGKTKIYLIMIYTTIVFSISEIATILLYKYTNGNELIFQITWRLRAICFIMFFGLYLIYHRLIVKNIKHDSIKDMLFKDKLNTISVISFTILTFIHAFVNKITFFNGGYIQYVTDIIGLALLVIFNLCGIYLFAVAYKNKKEDKKIYICFGIIAILYMITFLLQIVFKHVSFLPFICLGVIYIMYFNIENPDIELLEEVVELKEKIDKSSNAKLDFLFNLSHDLVNPMNVIVSLSENLNSSSEFNRDEVLRDINSIKYAGNTLLDSIDNILNISEDNYNDKVLNNKEYSTYELFNRLNSITTSRIGYKNVKFEMEIDDNISSKLYGDVVKVQKILLNILNNAVKFTEIGKIKLNITCDTSKDIQILHFKISDTGNGIKDEEKPFIFNQDKNNDSSGVGLAMSKMYVELLEGTIWFESVNGAGTTFYVDVPQTIVGTKLIVEDKNTQQSTLNIQANDLSNYKVLIVDEDELNAKVISRLLEKYNIQISTINSTRELINKVKKEEYFDIVFMEHKMPEIDGVETMKILRAIGDFHIPKLVIMTTNALLGARESYISKGFDEYISKPIDIYELDNILKKLLKPNKSQ